MEIFLNDRSIHQQFFDRSQFRESLDRVMAMREVAKKRNRSIYCIRGMSYTTPIRGLTIVQAVQQLDEAQRKAVLSWFGRSGPFWDEKTEDSECDRLECEGKCVVKSAVGEVAYRCLSGTEAALASFVPSEWDRDPVTVVCRTGSISASQTVSVANYRDAETLAKMLEATAPPITSWRRVQEEAVLRFSQLHFADECFKDLEGLPFKKSVAHQLIRLFKILNDYLAEGRDSQGKRTALGNEIIAQHFERRNAAFSDSSEREKQKFRRQLTFRHPGTGKSALFGWHGKIRSHKIQIRFHFTWPIGPNDPVYVVYVGQKRTKG